MTFEELEAEGEAIFRKVERLSEDAEGLTDEEARKRLIDILEEMRSFVQKGKIRLADC